MDVVYKVKLCDVSTNLSGEQTITFKLCNKDVFIKEKIKDLTDKDLKLEFGIFRNKRSLDANAYFHLLVNEIAKVQNIGNDECKVKMNLEYGSPAVDSNGDKIFVKLPKSANIFDFYQYAKHIKDVSERGCLCSYYLLYKQTHNLDSKEMARLIDGVVAEAIECGIETRTPQEIAKIKESWDAKCNSK